MNNRERFLTAVKLGEPDRVPYFDALFNEASIINVGKHFTSDLPEKKFFIDCTPEEVMKFLEVQMKFTRELDIDAISLFFTHGGSRIPGKKDLVRDRYGIVNKESAHGKLWPVDGPIKDPSDLKTFKAMLPDHSDFNLLKFIRDNMPERVVLFTVHGPFRFSWSLLGSMEKLLLHYVTNPAFCLQLARLVTDFVKEVVEISIDEGADVILMAGDMAFKTNTLMSPDHYRKFVKPYHHEVTELAHKRGIPIIKHSDGNISQILDDLIEAGFDGIHPIEPQSMEIEEVKEHLKGKACVVGNIDCTHLLPFGTEEEVVESVKETIKKAALGGGYILSSSNSIHPGCKSENVIAMFEAAKKYGTYPIEID